MCPHKLGLIITAALPGVFPYQIFEVGKRKKKSLFANWHVVRLSGIANKLCTNVQIKAFCAPRLRYVSRLRSITESPADDEINTLISSLWSLSSLHFTHNSRAFLHWSDYHSCASRSTGTWPNINGEFVNCRTWFRRRIRLFSNWLSADLGESLHYTSQLFLFLFFMYECWWFFSPSWWASPRPSYSWMNCSDWACNCGGAPGEADIER